VKAHKVGCVSSVDAVKELAARRAYKTIKQGLIQDPQYSKRFRETYHANKVTKDPSNPVSIKEPDQGMDFFHRLDQAKYGEFKLNVQNWWAMMSLKPPHTVKKYTG
jgi:hypothetical protein